MRIARWRPHCPQNGRIPVTEEDIRRLAEEGARADRIYPEKMVKGQRSPGCQRASDVAPRLTDSINSTGQSVLHGKALLMAGAEREVLK